MTAGEREWLSIAAIFIPIILVLLVFFKISVDRMVDGWWKLMKYLHDK